MRIAVVTAELHRTGGTERGTAEVVVRLPREHDVCLFAHRWEPDGGANVCFHRVAVMPWPGQAQAAGARRRQIRPVLGHRELLLFFFN